MGAKLREYYVEAQRRGGLPLQIKLTMRTGLSQPKAIAAPDSQENLRLFEAADRA